VTLGIDAGLLTGRVRGESRHTAPAPERRRTEHEREQPHHAPLHVRRLRFPSFQHPGAEAGRQRAEAAKKRKAARST